MGWTGQPAILRDNGKLYLMAGGFDHNLHKIELDSGRVVWEYAYDDIIKSSPTVIEDPHPANEADKYLVLAGSRRGCPSSFTDPGSGALPRRVVRHGQGGVAAAGAAHRQLQPRRGRQRLLPERPHVLGGGERLVLQARPVRDERLERLPQPQIVAQRLLLGDPGDASAHGGNLVLEASPSLLGDTIYISSGCGPRVRHAQERPQGGVGLPHRLRPRRHAGAHDRRASFSWPSRSSTSRATAAR